MPNLDRESYRLGFQDGYKAATRDFKEFGTALTMNHEPQDKLFFDTVVPHRRKAKQSKKQKLLTKMTKKKWDKYKKGRGKKTYVEIRAEVARSQKYKQAARRL